MHWQHKRGPARIPQPSPEERENAIWLNHVRPLSDEEIAEFEQQSIWDIGIFCTSDGPIKVFSTQLASEGAFRTHIDNLSDHFAAINQAEWPVVWEEPINPSVTRVSFILEGPVIGFDLNTLDTAEEHLEKYRALPWQHAIWSAKLFGLPDPPPTS
jgi:hypothetical protein